MTKNCAEIPYTSGDMQFEHAAREPEITLLGESRNCLVVEVVTGQFDARRAASRLSVSDPSVALADSESDTSDALDHEETSI